MSSNNPVFIGGMFKSGTSLLRAMLGKHSRLFSGLETQWLLQHKFVSSLADRRSWLDRIAVFYEISPQKIDEVCQGAMQVEECLDRLMTFAAARENKIRWIEKTPGNVGVIDRILSFWSGAKILHIVRDPRDVYASMVQNRKWTEPEAFAERWGGTFVAAREWLAEKGGQHPAYHELRYERLVRSPEETIGRVLRFLDEPWEASVATFEGVPEDFERVRRATGKESPTLLRLAQPLTRNRVGVWRAAFTAEEWAPVRAELDRRGYGPTLDVIIEETESIYVADAQCTDGVPAL